MCISADAVYACLDFHDCLCNAIFLAWGSLSITTVYPPFKSPTLAIFTKSTGNVNLTSCFAVVMVSVNVTSSVDTGRIPTLGSAPVAHDFVIGLVQIHRSQLFLHRAWFSREVALLKFDNSIVALHSALFSTSTNNEYESLALFQIKTS